MISRTHMHGVVLGRVFGFCLLGVASVSAEASDTAAVEDTADATAGQLGEVVVTARRRSESLQETPIAIAAFGAAELEERNVGTVADVARFVPNVNLDSASNLSGSSASMTAFIRGVGQTDFVPTIDPGVGIYLDGVYVGRTVGALLETANIESVQVLRGPQGTLFGKNTIGGAVVLTSKRPGNELAGDVRVSLGSYDRVDVSAGLDVPLGSVVRMRINGAHESRDGYVHRATDGGHMGNKDSLSGRIVLEASPTDSLDLSLSVDATRKREEAAPVSLINVDEEGIFALFHNQLLFGDQCLPPAPVSNPNCYTQRWISADGSTNYSNAPNASDLDLYGTALTATWRLGGVELKSITAYRWFDSSFYWDGDASPLVISHSDDRYEQSQLSQEFQLSGRAYEDRLRWVMGLYYLRELAEDVNLVSLSFAQFASGGSVDNKSYATFGQATLNLSERWNLTLGGRYTKEKKGFTPDQYVISVDPLAATDFGVGLDPANPTCYYFICNPLTSSADPPGTPLQPGDRILPLAEASVSATEFTPSVSLDYRATDQVMLYASYSKGFKGGGFTQRIFPPEPAASSFQPEKASAVELGAKTEWFDRRWRLNVALFSTDYTDLQQIVNEGIAPKVRNAGKARINGVELESEAALGSRVRLSASAGYLDAQYRRLAPNVAGITLGSRLPYAPKWTTSAGLGVDLYSGAVGTLTLRGDWSYKGAVYKDAVNSPDLYQRSYSLVSAGATFAPGSGRYRVIVGGTNLTDRRVIESGYSNLAFDSVSEVTYGRPREWFATLEMSF